MPTHRRLDDELDTLRGQLTRMFEAISSQYAEATHAMLHGDAEQARRVHGQDDQVDALELEIDDTCERILALQAPVATDLRAIITAIKVNTDLERIGDHCKNLAKHTPVLAGGKALRRQTCLENLVKVVQEILHEARRAFLEQDVQQARRVIEHDAEADALYRRTLGQIIHFCEAHPEEAEALCHLVDMNKALERIGDHSRNIAQSVIFWIEGEDVRHRRIQVLKEAQQILQKEA